MEMIVEITPYAFRGLCKFSPVTRSLTR